MIMTPAPSQIELFPPAYLATDDWTFEKDDTRTLTHCYHDYPARMIPQVAGKLIDNFGKKAMLLFDPYCGTGTSLVEALVRGIDAVGTDLNPLARLIAQAKTTRIKTDVLDKELRRFEDWAMAPRHFLPASYEAALGVKDINLKFWFQPNVIKKLYLIKEFINALADDKIKLFFKVAFSQTVREASNTRTDEVKLYRYIAAKLASHNPDVFAILSDKLRHNREGLENFLNAYPRRLAPKAEIHGFNTVDGVPKTMPAGCVDLVLTSPPYGDSRTTLAYGQFSRLSAAWLGLESSVAIDRELMGGRKQSGMWTLKFPCAKLNFALAALAEIDDVRAEEVFSFYCDLQRSIRNVAALVRKYGHACYVVRNRRVKDIALPTDEAVRDFFGSCGFEHVHTFVRSTANKRMPLKNSPSNVSGPQEAALANEFIVVMQKLA